MTVRDSKKHSETQSTAQNAAQILNPCTCGLPIRIRTYTSGGKRPRNTCWIACDCGVFVQHNNIRSLSKEWNKGVFK